jgi:hypothetical protein
MVAGEHFRHDNGEAAIVFIHVVKTALKSVAVSSIKGLRLRGGHNYMLVIVAAAAWFALFDDCAASMMVFMSSLRLYGFS